MAAGCRWVAGVDEAGRGAWAGPLVAGAVVLWDLDRRGGRGLEAVRDSKQLAPAERERLLSVISARAWTGVGRVGSEEVDLLGLTAANELAMIRALHDLPLRPDHVIVDAFVLRSYAAPQTPIVGGDRTCLSIAAASIVAKVARDRMMLDLDRSFPAYAFANHKGYGTPEHRRALATVGACSIHRRSYAPVAALRGLEEG